MIGQFRRLAISTGGVAISPFLAFLSFQQGLFTYVVIICHTTTLLIAPFNKLAQRREMRAGLLALLVAALETLGIILPIFALDMQVTASHQLCQSATLTPGGQSPAIVLFLVVYGLCLFVACALTCGIVVFLRRSNKHGPSYRTKTYFKLQVLKKSCIVMVVIVVSLATVLVVEGLQRIDYEISTRTLLALTISVTSLNKACNPWIYSFRLIGNMVSGKKSKR